MSKRYPGGIIRKTPQTPSQTSAQGVWDMTSVTQAVKENTWPIAGVPDPISRSLRFRSSAGAYLNRTFATGNRRTFTWSGWLKRGSLTGNQALMSPYTNSTGSGTYGVFRFVDGSIEFLDYANGTYNAYFYTSSSQYTFRDPSAWYHIVLAVDTTQATGSDRIKIYVNGTQITGTFYATPTINYDLQWNNNLVNYIGYTPTASQYFDGYLTEINFIDGQALTPSSFGGTNDQTGVWQPIAYTGTYGTNGFYLPFSNNTSTTTLGFDFSGNSNNWTTNNISLTSGSTYDSMVDVPTQWIPYNTAGDTGALYRGNYCVLNPLDKATNFTLAGANLNFTPANISDLYSCRSTFQIPSTGKWIWEVTNTNSAYMITAGLLSGSTALVGQQTVTCASMTVGSIGTFFSTSQWMNTTTTWSVTNVGNGDTLVIAYDADGGKIWFGRVASGGTTVTWYNTSGTADPSTGTDPRASSITAGGWFAGFGTYYTPSGASANFGQRPFSFTNIPTGFKALNTFNLPTPTIGATASTQANDYFDINLYTGTGADQSLVNSGAFQPDFVWIKSRSTASGHVLTDAVRGAGKTLYSNNTDAETTDTEQLQSFNSNGFTVGTTGDVNFNGRTYVGWQWRASNATAVTNTAGTITSTVSANTSAGFSIVTYTGTGANATVGHGLGVAPAMIIIKNRSITSDWNVYHQSLGNTGRLRLNLTDAFTTDSAAWNDTSPSSTVFTLGNGSYPNGNGNSLVAYCFAQVAGYSAFGSYTGNGSSDGTFVYTGFRPRFVMIKSSSTGGAGYDWFMWDSSRNTYNVIDHALWANLSDAENTTAMVDFVSNGFKIRLNSSAMNGNGTTFIYAAFAESPFKYALAR